MSLFRVVPDVVRTQKYLSCTDERKLEDMVDVKFSLVVVAPATRSGYV